MTSEPARIELLVLDVDGVLTDGLIRLDDMGRETKTFHVRDGQGLRVWMRLGHQVAIITGRSSQAVTHRAGELGITHVYQGVREKERVLNGLAESLDLRAEAIAVMGDDLPDLGMMRRGGYRIAVADAVEEIRAIADFVTASNGGRGAVREAVEHLLKARDDWERAVALHDGVRLTNTEGPSS